MPGLLTVLVHPDDETMMSALLFALAKNDIDVHLSVVTKGEGGKLGDPPIAHKQNIAMVRETEMKAAAFVLRSKSLSFFGAEDPTPLTNAKGERVLAAPHMSYAHFSEVMTKIITNCRPDAVITHGSNGEYGHPGHVQTGSFCRKYVQEELNGKLALYTMAAHDPRDQDRTSNQDDHASYFLDRAAYHEQCFTLLRCHLCQHVSFVKNVKNTDANFLHELKKASTNKKREAYKFWGTQAKDTLSTWLSDELYR